MTKWWVVAVLAVLPSIILGACPNKCSGHGSCTLNDVCICMQSWIGGDCSGRQCPFTRAWQDTAQRNDDAHYYAECGNRGTCDRTTGECLCDAGFVGSGCRRMQCPNDCSGHGTCEFIEEIASNTYSKRVGGVSGRTYTLWDQEKIMGCVCDANYEGHDCSLRTCPRGDDPLTPNQFDMWQAVVIGGTFPGSFYLTYYDPYGNAYTTEKIATGSALTPAGTTTTCANIQTALRQLPNNVLNTVTVSAAARFYSFKRKDPTDLTGAELAECAGRGTCGYTTGTCECFAGHMGLACQKQEALV
ncbi:hypothetical protein BBJ29_004301 [Phytophthora kernoviae]|uniref:EGF-like domain-containing protein n=1 Tax=Phytophthora kernoviae TaxID=325452 RepID=A0A3F2RLT4_9STRA|nr:hypothetical protein BBJ29_004301 [Phytophthora kernoviae]RLN60102.1 hypothetical protein BBP00_00006168 [Phytophthora kernoviae]